MIFSRSTHVAANGIISFSPFFRHSRKLIYLKKFYFIWEYSWLTMFCQFQVYSKVIQLYTCVCVLVIQLCTTLCDPMDCSQPGSPVLRNLQAGILELVSIHFSRGSSQTRGKTWVFCMPVRFFYCLSHQGNPVIHIPVSVLFQIFFPFRFLNNIEHNSLWYTENC